MAYEKVQREMIVIVDYGMGNLRSVQKAFERVGHAAMVSGDPTAVQGASKLVLPGVGAFGAAMENLRVGGLVDPLLDGVRRGVPLLGICLGIQLFFTESEEKGIHQGLNLLPGQVRLFPETERVPQIGWNQIHIKESTRLIEGVPDGAFFYFVHSYYVDPEDESDIVATTDYGVVYPSIVARGKVFGIQFHPEKSQDLGLRILKNFAEL